MPFRWLLSKCALVCSSFRAEIISELQKPKAGARVGSSHIRTEHPKSLTQKSRTLIVASGLGFKLLYAQSRLAVVSLNDFLYPPFEPLDTPFMFL